MDGIRTVKTNGSTIHHYTLNGSQIVTETWTTKSSSGTETPTTSWYTSMMRTAFPSGCSTETRPMERIRLTPTTSRRTCKGTSSPYLHRGRDKNRLLYLRCLGQLHLCVCHRGHHGAEANCPHAQSIPVSGVLLRYGHGAVLSAKPVSRGC